MTIIVTAALIPDIQFKTTRFKPGYDEDEVDDYLDDVQVTLEHYEKLRDDIVEVLLKDRRDLSLQRELLTLLGLQPQLARIDLDMLDRVKPSPS